MTDEILVSVKGFHTQGIGEEEDEIEVLSAGKYYLKNGKHYILFDETDAEDGSITKNRIILEDGRMVLQKRGILNTRLVFEKNSKSQNDYHTPAGRMIAGIEVTKLDIRQMEELLEVCVEYALEFNYEKVADCRIQIKVMPKDSALFQLT